MKTCELKQLLQDAINRCNETVGLLRGSDNPQVKETVIRSKSELLAYESVLSYLNGDKVLLKLAANK